MYRLGQTARPLYANRYVAEPRGGQLGVIAGERACGLQTAKRESFNRADHQWPRRTEAGSCSRCEAAANQVVSGNDKQAEHCRLVRRSWPLWDAVHSLLDGKSGPDRHEIAEELVGHIRAIARHERPPVQTDPTQRDAHELEPWAQRIADAIEIARMAHWHMPNAAAEAAQLTKIRALEGCG